MKRTLNAIAFLCFVAFSLSLFAESGVKPATIDIAAIQDASTLETKVLQEWQPVAKLKGVKQKLVEITVCEWWPGQKVRLPVTFCAPESSALCTNVIVGNMGLASKPAVPSGAMLELLTQHGVGVVLVGMGTIDAMEPKGELHLGMKQHLLDSKDARYTPAWIWGMSDMRGLTAAIAESSVFQPKKVLATGGSKRGVGAAVCGIHDSRFTAIMPVVAPILGNPGSAYVRGSFLQKEDAMNIEFLNQISPGSNPLGLPATARQSLEEREERRLDQAITIQQALAAGWTEEEMRQMNDEAWNLCKIAKHLDRVRNKGLEYFYHVGTNDNVCPSLMDLGRIHPEFPLYILPGGQHGGPTTSGFTLQTPTQPEADENFYAFARHHFFNDRSIPPTPKVKSEFDAATNKLKVTITVAPGQKITRQSLSWCENRHPPYTLAAEYDAWQSREIQASPTNTHIEWIQVPSSANSIDFISTHTSIGNEIPFHFSSPYQRWRR
ncbi:MAG: hypothetical protein SGI77_19730 [Pirellulaceae bacterium]|nr:hypothetical protein [Pirellulaceae bacterium]